LFSDGLHHSAARIELGDLRILKETSNRISGTYNYDSEKATITVEGFFNHIHNFIYLEPTGVETTIRGSFPVWEYKQVNAILFGADLNMRYEINRKFVVQNKSSFMKGKDVSSNRDLIDIPSLKTTNLVRFTNKKWSNFSAEIQSELVFRQRNFPNNNFEAYIPRTDSFILVDISSPPPAYHLLNVRSDFDLKISKKENVRVAFSINNLLNTSYRENLNRLRYFADEIGRNFSIQLIYNY
jgi:iron complex outermembrane receptor protein